MTEAESTGTEAERAKNLTEAVGERAATLTRRARGAVDDNERAAYLRERDALLADHGYAARVREDDTGETLVCHPEEWIEDGIVQIERVDDTDRAVEVSLSGPAAGDDWDAVEAHNRAVADRVREKYGEIHGANAHAFADFMGNHYAKPLEAATPAEREEFRTEYFPRNAWPSDEQREAVTRSLQVIDEISSAE
jgi:hypothetical protein